MRRTCADKARRKLIEIGFTKHNRARRRQPLHHFGTFFRLIRKGGTGRTGWQTCDINIVLHREGYAEQSHAAPLLARHGVEHTRLRD